MILTKSTANKIVSCLVIIAMISTIILALFATTIASDEDNESQLSTGSPYAQDNKDSGGSGERTARTIEKPKFWATFQFDYSNTGNTSSNAPDSNNTLWKFDAKDEIYSSPVIVHDSIYFATKGGFLYSLNRTTGNPKWSSPFNLQKPTFGTLTVANGYIYIGTGTEEDGFQNNLFRINAETGLEDTAFRISIPDGAITGAPVVYDPMADGNYRIYFGTLRENKVHCYNIGMSQPQPYWEYAVPNPGTSGSDGIWSSLVYCNTRKPGEPDEEEKHIIIFSTNSISSDKETGLTCLKANSGNLLWKFPPDTGALDSSLQTYSSPTTFFDARAQQHKVLIGMGTTNPAAGILYCLDMESGTELWNFTTGGGDFNYGVVSSPAVAYEKIIFGACDGKLYAVDFDGNLLWDFQTNDAKDGIYCSPAVADNKVFFGSEDRIIYCLDVINGSLIWEYDTTTDSTTGIYGLASSPAVAYGRMYIGSGNGYLYCFGMLDSEPPSIFIEEPQDYSVVSDEIEIRGMAEDDVEVTKVEVKIDENGTWNKTLTTSSWFYTWNTSTVPDGPHSIFARAHDRNGWSITNVTVIVNNALDQEMLIQVTSHRNGQIVSGITKFIGNAYHRTGTIIDVQVNIDNSMNWTKVNGTTNWTYFWDTKNHEDGEHIIRFRGYDGFINSTPINLTVNVSNYIAPTMPGSFPVFRSKQNRIGISGYSVPREGNLLWKFETENQVESSPIFFNNNIYFGSDDYIIYCLDSNTGVEQWRYETGNQVRSSPAIANQKLYIGSHDRYFYCLNAISGEFNWSYRTGDAIDSSPLIVDDKVIFGSYDGYLYALNASSGDEIWIFNTGDELWGSPAYADECIYIGNMNGIMYCVWLSNGTERWNISTLQSEQLHGIYSTPVVTEGNVIFGSQDNRVYCLNSSTGDLIWKFKTTGYVYSSAAVNNNRVFISSLESENDGILYALPLNDPNDDHVITSSEVIWEFPTHDYDGGSSPMVSVTSGKVVIGSNAGTSGGIGKVHCIDEKTGDEYWNFTTDGDIHGSPIIASSRVYIGSLDGYMYCLGKHQEDQENIRIMIEINIPVTTVTAGHAIENITFTALTNTSEPIPQTWFTFAVTRGALSDYYGTAFEDGSYSISYIAPAPSEVKKSLNVTIFVNASRFPYINGSNFVNISVEPRSQPSVNGGTGTNGDNKDNDGTDKDDDIFDEISKPKYQNYILIISILVILNIVIILFLVRTRLRLKRFEKPKRLGETGSTQGTSLEKEGHKDKVSSMQHELHSKTTGPQPAHTKPQQPITTVKDNDSRTTSSSQPLAKLVSQLPNKPPEQTPIPAITKPTAKPYEQTSSQPVVNDPTKMMSSEKEK